jgi:hypothetical protein
MPRLRRAARVVPALLVASGAIGDLANPMAVRWALETVAAREVGSLVKVESVSANPFTLTASLRSLEGDGAPGDGELRDRGARSPRWAGRGSARAAVPRPSWLDGSGKSKLPPTRVDLSLK